MKRTFTSIALSVLATTAVAHDGMHGPGSKFDVDENGGLSLQEYTAYLKDNKQDVSRAAAMFAALDTNKDGLLSSAEFIKGLARNKK
jgi:hypothetical protein